MKIPGSYLIYSFYFRFYFDLVIMYFKTCSVVIMSSCNSIQKLWNYLLQVKYIDIWECFIAHLVLSLYFHLTLSVTQSTQETFIAVSIHMFHISYRYMARQTDVCFICYQLRFKYLVLTSHNAILTSKNIIMFFQMDAYA